MENPQASLDEQAIIQRLLAAGWLKAPGAQALGTASMVYDNGEIELWVQQEYNECEIIIVLTTADGLELPPLHAEYGQNLDALLESLIASQDQITIRNFREHVLQWLVVCPALYVQGDDEDSEAMLLTSDFSEGTR